MLYMTKIKDHEEGLKCIGMMLNKSQFFKIVTSMDAKIDIAIGCFTRFISPFMDFKQMFVKKKSKGFLKVTPVWPRDIRKYFRDNEITFDDINLSVDRKFLEKIVSELMREKEPKPGGSKNS